MLDVLLTETSAWAGVCLFAKKTFMARRPALVLSLWTLKLSMNEENLHQSRKRRKEFFFVDRTLAVALHTGIKEGTVLAGTLDGRPSPFRLNEIIPTLRQAEARLGQYIDAHPHDVIQLSITDLADRSQTSEATVVRLCRKLGFRGFQDFKIGLAQSLVGPVQTIHEEVEESDTPDSVKAKVFGATIQALQDTMTVIDSRELNRAVDLLLGSAQVLFVGAGNSGWVCMDAALKLMKAGVQASAYVDQHSQLVAACLLGPGTAVVGISHSGATMDTVQAMETAKKGGAATICITGTPKSPITRLADVRLFTSAKETGFKTEAMTSRIAQLAIIDTLFVNVGLRRGREAAAGIQRVREATAKRRL